MPDSDPIATSIAALRGPWLVTGAAGFIGSHLVEALLRAGQHVLAVDDLSTGRLANLRAAQAGARGAGHLEFHRLDVRDRAAIADACRGVGIVLHQAALGSVPRSVAEPWPTHAVNVDGSLAVLDGARQAGCAAVVVASSSSVYGDDPALPKREAVLGAPLSPYAASKRAVELYAEVYARQYGLPVVGLRYFNVVGPRQDPDGPYAAVVPRWIAALAAGRAPELYGDGTQSRDFCPVRNVVLANLLAARAAASGRPVLGRHYNVALGERTTLRELFALLQAAVGRHRPAALAVALRPGPARAGDILHSQACLEQIRAELGYEPVQALPEALEGAVEAALAPSAQIGPNAG